MNSQITLMKESIVRIADGQEAIVRNIDSKLNLMEANLDSKIDLIVMDGDKILPPRLPEAN